MKDVTNIKASGTRNLRLVKSDEQIVDDVQADFDRRRKKLHGRFLLWLLRKTT